jgi:hypothetical protein
VLSLVCFVFASYNGISALNGPQSGGQTLSPTGIGGFVFGGANATSSRHSGNGLEVVGSNGGLSSAPSARERAWSARTTKDLRPPSRCGTVRLVSVAILRLLLDFSRFVYLRSFLLSHLQAATAARGATSRAAQGFCGYTCRGFRCIGAATASHSTTAATFVTTAATTAAATECVFIAWPGAVQFICHPGIRCGTISRRLELPLCALGGRIVCLVHAQH